MTIGERISNRDLDERAGFRLDGQTRVRLNNLGFVDSELVGGMYHHELTENGWKWCSDELTNERPACRDRLGKALYSVLQGLGGYTDRANLALAEIFGAAEPAADADLQDVDSQIRAAYHGLASEPGAWVSLARLRQRLVGIARPEVDAALSRLEQQPDVTITPEANQKTLTPADHEAAVTIGGRPKHLISIAS